MTSDVITPDIAILWAATELTKAWVGTGKIDPSTIVNTFNTIYTGISNTATFTPFSQ
ncbi:MAG TPA: hypothetical protein VMX96_06745 [Dehalococcoidia bacterium]|nr:hypothetical protein [Dehalococcoidia bacterium]